MIEQLRRSAAVERDLNAAEELTPSEQPVRFWELGLDAAVAASIRERAVLAPSPHTEYLRYSVASRKLATLLPDSLLTLLTLFRTHPQAPGALVIKGLPIDPDLVATPGDGGRSNKESFDSEAMQGAIGSFFGDLFSYATEKKGEIIQNIVPVASRELVRSNEGSRADFWLHTENAFFDFRPDYLLLLALRAGFADLATTTMANAREALALISSEHAAILRQSLFQIAAPESFLDSHGHKVWSRPLPVITGDAEHPESRVNFNGVMALTEAAEDALQAWRMAVDHVTVGFVLQPGEMLVIDNRKALHGRKPFNAQFGPKARWLQRAYVRSTLWHGRERSKNRVNLF
jgi:L-asparagine oxygenase